MDNVKEELLKIARENVNKKLDEERKLNEEKIIKEIKDVDFILKLIEKKMLYKVIGNWRENQKFQIITKEIFLEDYMSEPNDSWHKKGIHIKNWKSWEQYYELEIKINDEIEYKHIGFIIQDFTQVLKDKTDRMTRINTELREIESQFKELVNQESDIMKFVKDYEEVKKQLNNED